MRVSLLLLIPLMIQTVQSQDMLDFTSDSLVVVLILQVNNLNELSVGNVAEVDGSRKRIIGLSLGYAWGCGCIGGVPVDKLLSVLPHELGQLTELKYLYLGDTELDSIPEEIGNLTKLEELDVGWSNITSLPKGITKLSNLKKLRLDVNSFDSFPEVVFNLKAMEELQLSHLPFDSVPAGIGNCTSLTSLSIQFGSVSFLPKEIGLLTGLLKLNIYQNDIASLPPEFGNLIALKHLELAGNRLAFLPGEITALHSLAFLDLSENRLCDVADSIAVWIEENLQQYQLDWRSSQNCSNRIAARSPSFHNQTGIIDVKASGGSVLVSYQLAKSCRVDLALYDIHGKLVRKLRDDMQTSGSYSVLCEMNGLSRNIYLLRIVLNGSLYTKKISIIK